MTANMSKLLVSARRVRLDPTAGGDSQIRLSRGIHQTGSSLSRAACTRLRLPRLIRARCRDSHLVAACVARRVVDENVEVDLSANASRSAPTRRTAPNEPPTRRDHHEVAPPLIIPDGMQRR
jgi:hypothetical protein